MRSSRPRADTPRPFLKWAGGKSQLLERILVRVDAAGPFRAYHEPFLGGGAVYFELHRTGRIGGRAVLSDANPNLVDAWLGVQQAVDEVIAELRVHARKHGPEWYYQVRRERPSPLAARAARVIYLNKTCYNGLYRENSRGEFNVPMGRYVNPTILDEENLRACAAALQGAEIQVCGFEASLARVEAGDLVYLDPPYAPLSPTASFTSYAAGGFGEAEQRRLAAQFRELEARAVRALLSNSDTPLTRALYGDFQERCESVVARRAVNSRPDRRGAVAEILVRNFD